MRAALSILCAALSGARAFYLPGVAVREYQQDERVEIKVNKLTSTKTQLVRGTSKRSSLHFFASTRYAFF